MTTPTEFVLWLNGALGVMDDTPTPEQMAKIREKISEAIGKITADRLLERADEQIKLDKDRIERDLKAQEAREKQMSMMAQEYARKLDELKYQTLAYSTGITSAQQAGMAALAGRVTEIPPASKLNPFGALRKKSAK